MLELVTDTRLDLAVSAARHGDGLFETLRVARGHVLRLERHLARLARGAAFFGYADPPPAEMLHAFVHAHLGLSGMAAGALRLIAVDGRLHVSAEPMDLQPLPPVPVALARSLRRFSGSPLNRFKTLSYLENAMLAREARRRGLFEVLALNEQGRLTDGSRTNLILVRAGEALTPPAAAGALPGILRELLLEAGVLREADLGLEDLREAQAVILCNALRGLIPARPLAGAGRGEAPERLLRDLEAAAEA